MAHTPTTAESDVPAAAPSAPLGPRIAGRLPEILIEALFMLVAVVLAFAIEEWREERELDGLAAEARAAILQEMTRNRDELLESKPSTTEANAALASWLDGAAPDAPRAEADAPSATLSDPAVNLELALLSSAAWRAAQSTEASRRMDYTWMLQISQIYELQAMYQEAQSATLEAIVRYRASMDPTSRQANARALLGRIRVLSSLGEALEDDYAEIL